MLRYVTSLILSLCCLSALAQDIVCAERDKQVITSLLADASSLPKDTNLMMHFAKAFMGVPYVGGTLDRDTRERLVVNTRELDCTTYVETVLALALCVKNHELSFDDYCRHLRAVRYIDGDVAYTKRQHYFTVWMDANERQGIVKKVEHNPPFTATQTLSINYMTQHVSAYKMLSAHPEWLPGIRSMEQSMNGKQYQYIPKESLKPSRENNKALHRYIKDGDIIAILTNKKGLDTTHIGIASWHADGLHLINASSIHKKVVDEPKLFYDYMKEHPSQIGIRVVRMNMY